MYFSTYHLDVLIVLAVNSTLGILNSAVQAPSVKRVSYFSATAVYVTTSVKPNVWDDSGWNWNKTLAGQSTWTFHREQKEKSSIECDFVSLCPPWVLEPALHEFDGKANHLDHWNSFLYNAIIKGDFCPSDESYVDGQDLTKAILLAITKPAAAGQRFILAAGQFR
ncbi:hypothetical protein BD309DRAFT_991417 [Dichomitus squalens]|uniref:Uncharacterized protein n=1 Tax=Dichomitus squalens TaxID=114155 RepID=A0A4Q9PHP4_9APHY|nr:uncharacterized protein DICSQDRAFT_167263 [Dichomitus squalens LYAD-421 SS1]EJF64094.1 hypothetical protein DICSQDRAFT_167263 [Dichomitus squalens LYAD-421 SS1]TBU42809.1 hypothetical protein BD309DRAFT_991417 [Dichomitus squalens]TBU53201.1 hypothetical protein BD310DRAFT_830509 [Dichomitus squalens]